MLRELAVTPLIKGIREQAKECAERELAKALKKGYLKHSDKEEAYRLIHQVFKAFLHSPTINLKSLAGAVGSEAQLRAVGEGSQIYLILARPRIDEFNLAHALTSIPTSSAQGPLGIPAVLHFCSA